MKNKLLFLVTEDWYFLSHRLSLAVAAKKVGFEVSVATRVGEASRAIEASGIRVLDFAIDRRGMNVFKELHAVFRIALLLRKERPHLFHMVALKPVLLGNLAARLIKGNERISAIAGLGFLFTESGRGGLMMPVIRRLLGHSLRGSTVIVQNSDDAQSVTELGVSSNVVRIIRGAGVDLDRFQVTPESVGVPVVMLPSRMLWDKGVGEFVSAARTLKAKGVKARFVLVGAVDLANPAGIPQEKLAEWNEEGVVEIWGHQQTMEDVLPQAQVICLPSYREGLPKVLLEAMACGRPVVTCDVPGCREVVIDGETGMVVAAKDSQELGGAIWRMLENPGLREQFGAAGRRRVEEYFGLELVIGQTLDVYKEVLGR